MNRILSKLILGTLSLFVLFTSCKKPEEVVIHEDRENFNLEEQQSIGKNLSELISLHSTNIKPLDKASNQDFYNYADQILESIVNTNLVETRNIFDWELVILENNNEQSAFTIPGGKIYITTGLLKMITGENELFSILSHELYYGDQGEIITAMKIEYGADLVSDLKLGTTSQYTIDIAKSIHTLSFTDAQVAKADSFALDMICPFQYEANGLNSFIERASSMADQIAWINNRPRSQEALVLLGTVNEACGIEELTFTERYASFKNLLP